MRNSIRRFKGGSSGPTETTVTNQNIPDWLKPQMTALLARSEFESNQPYLPYSQQRLAGFSPAERMAQQGIGSMAMFGDPMATREAQRRVSQAPNVMTSGIAQAYMSPYFSQALDPLKDETRRQSAISARDIRDQAAGAGGLGGYREAIMQSERQRDLNRQLSDIEKVGRQDAFLDASRRFEADRDSQLQRADRLSALGSQQQAMGLERLKELQRIGEQQRSLQQASLDMGYQDFLRQQGYPQQQLGFYENILKGTYSRPNETVSTFGRNPNLFSSILGGGIQAAGLLNMAGGGKVRGGLTSLGIANAMRGSNAR
ncbi:MAG: hypothetical protein GOVbin2604_50 [Gammaproteobacteria virus GOV_bin_2604]|nr:MAG: hypothetical protein GOVbin2604_50 [Gammaproteobacteria virus GOV_bin_2604]|tara:strand:+ start:304 stop:1248 length:945 start_codon:yes stop_codon:yes gene_type:complete